MFFTSCVVLIYFLGHQSYSETIGLENSSIILSDTRFDSINPHFTVANNSIYSTWVSKLSTNNSEILFKKVEENARFLSSAVNISNATGISNLVKLSSSDDNVYLTWEDKQVDKWKLLFSKSHDKGIKFGTTTNLSNDTGNVHLHDLASAGGNVFVVWAANENISSSNKEIFFRKSQDGGNSFDNVLNLSNDGDDSLDPHMVINQNGSIIYIVWTKCDIKHDDPNCSVAFTRSLDQGNTFTDTSIIDTDKVMSQGSNITSTNTVLDYNSSMIPRYLLDNLTANRTFSSINPTVFTALGGKQVYVLWEENTFGKGDSEIFIKSSNDYGNSFNSAINISNSSGTSRLAHGHILGEDLYVTWADTLNQSGTFDIMLRKINSKNQLGKVLNLSNNSGNSVSPYLLINNNDRIYVTWSDSSYDSSILLSTIDPSGSTFTKKILKRLQTAAFSNPMIFETRDKLWISWIESNNDVNKIVLMDQEKL